MKSNTITMWGIWLCAALLMYLESVFFGGPFERTYYFTSMLFFTALIFTWVLLDARENG